MRSITRSNLFKVFIVMLSLGFVSACSTSISSYKDSTPKLVIEDFFDGKLTAHGVVKNFKGKVIRHFNADIKAYWKDGVGVLDEDFVFDDGEQQKRIWTITPTKMSSLQPAESRKYIGTANDVIGESLIEISGNAMFLNYVLQIPYKKKTMNIKVDDRMYLVDSKTIINESKLYKFGLPVGSIILTIVKQ